MAKDNARQFEMQLAAIEEWRGIPDLDPYAEKLLGLRQQLLETSKFMTP